MKIREFIEKYQKNNGMSIFRSIKAKSYLSFADKQALVNEVLRKCQVTNYGYIQFDETKKYIVFTIEVIKTYTDLEFDDDFNVAITEYDALCEANLLNSIIELFEGEYKTVLNMLGMRQDYILQGNSIDAQIARFLNGLNDKLDTLIESITDATGSFSLDSLNITSEDISKLTDFVKKLGK